MGIRIPQIPDELLENIRQYIGNCRIWQGQLIKTIDKNSDEFKMIEANVSGVEIGADGAGE